MPSPKLKSQSIQGRATQHLKQLQQLQKDFGIDHDLLNNWLEQQSLIPTDVFSQFTHFALDYQLNPLNSEICIEKNNEQLWEIYISITGWISLLHRQTNWAGITFTHAPIEEEGIPIWMECSIYRKDMQTPITVREYLCELRSNHIAWQKIPRRMLRHKALEEAVRLAFGIRLPPPLAQSTQLQITNISTDQSFATAKVADGKDKLRQFLYGS